MVSASLTIVTCVFALKNALDNARVNYADVREEEEGLNIGQNWELAIIKATDIQNFACLGFLGVAMIT